MFVNCLFIFCPLECNTRFVCISCIEFVCSVCRVKDVLVMSCIGRFFCDWLFVAFVVTLCLLNKVRGISVNGENNNAV